MNIEIFSLQIPIYGILFYLGIALAVCVAALISAKRKLPIFDIVGSAVYSMTGAVLGAKLLFIIVSFQQIRELFATYPFADALLSVLKGGFVFYGGLIGGASGLLIYVKQFKMRLSDFTDIYTTVIPLGHAVGRVGCFFAGCCYGIEYHGPFRYVYTSSAGMTPLGVPLLPIQLIEAALLLVLFNVLLLIFLKSEHLYLCTAVYAIGYALLRFVLEFWRGDAERGLLWGFSTSQWISLAIFIGVFLVIGVGCRRSKRRISPKGISR